KIYLALVQGHPDPSVGTIDAPIGRHPSSSWRFAVLSGGRDSITHYETLEAYSSASMLRVTLETGRTHQIRVHMSAQKHPIVGDTLYGADPTIAERLGVTRQWLHASELEFAHPVSGEVVKVKSPVPGDLQVALERLKP
ncbi:MAG: pseudouridine synthase, partial [Pontimonas sp.]